jgi:hypothetical protein
VSDLKTWWHPLHLPCSSRNLPSLGSYFYKRLFLWMPRKMWLFDFKCTSCVRHSLSSKGLYHRVRSVIDIKNRYYLAAEYLECSSCKEMFISYDHSLMEQLTEDYKARFGIFFDTKVCLWQSYCFFLCVLGLREIAQRHCAKISMSCNQKNGWEAF